MKKLAIAILLLSSIASAQSLDQYGGANSSVCVGGVKAHFYVEQIGTRWWYCTPLGHRMFSNAVWTINPEVHLDYQFHSQNQIYQTKYGAGTGQYTWAAETNSRLKYFGFNGIYPYSSAYINPWRTGGSIWPVDGFGARSQPQKMSAVIFSRPQIYSMSENTTLGSQNTAGLPGPFVGGFLTPTRTDVYTGFRSETPDIVNPQYAAFVDADIASQASIINGNYGGYVLGTSIDDTDQLWGMGTGYGENDFANTNYLLTIIGGVKSSSVAASNSQWNIGWGALITPPCTYQHKQPASTPHHIVTDCKIYTKQDLNDWLSTRYGGSIAALNTAWGAHYTGFGSSSTVVTGETLAVTPAPNGVATTFTVTLAHGNVDPWSVVILVTGVGKLADNAANGVGTANGCFYSHKGTTCTGTMTYSSGAISMTFASAPAAGAVITATYRYGGWGRGSKLMDEDGKCPAGGTCWIPSDARLVKGTTIGGVGTTTQAFHDDVLLYLRRFSDIYFSALQQSTKTTGKTLCSSYPACDSGVMYLGPGYLMGWGTPSPPQVLASANVYVDVINISIVPPFSAAQRAVGGFVDDTQARFDLVAKYAPNRPYSLWVDYLANPGSVLFPFTNNFYDYPTGAAVTTQLARGQLYSDLYDHQFLGMLTFDSVYHIIGTNMWAAYDDPAQNANFGIFTESDNAYDGITDVGGTTTCGVSAGYTTNYTCAPEWNQAQMRLDLAVQFPGNACISSETQFVLDPVTSTGALAYPGSPFSAQHRSLPKCMLKLFAATTAVTLNDRYKPTTPNGHLYFVSVAGTTAGAEPTWPTGSGSTVVNGTATFKEGSADTAFSPLAPYDANFANSFAAKVQNANARWQTLLPVPSSFTFQVTGASSFSGATVLK